MRTIRRPLGYIPVAVFLAFALIGVAGLPSGGGFGTKIFFACLLGISLVLAYAMWRMMHITIWRGRLHVWPLMRPYSLRADDIAATGLARDVNGFGQAGVAPTITLRSGRTLKFGWFFTRRRADGSSRLAQEVVDAVEAFRAQ